MILTVLKPSFAKQKPRVLNYRNYKFFNNTLFRDQLLNKLRNSNLQISDKDLKHFKETSFSVVNTIAPLKSRCIRANQVPLKVDPNETKKYTINKEINVLVYSGKSKKHTIRI